LRLIERPHVHVALGGPSLADSRGRPVTTRACFQLSRIRAEAS
jgi:hypothetical protein